MKRDSISVLLAEDELRRARDELEVRVKERTAELSEVVTALQEEITHRQFIEGQLREAIAGLEQHNKAKSEFVTNVSHELKTPLISMMYGTRNLLKGIAGPLPEKAIRYLKMFDIECQRLVGTINDILDFGKIDNKALILSMMTVPLGRLMVNSVDPLHIQMEPGQMDLEIAIDPKVDFVKCDPDRIQRVIQNLVSNAIKFTPPPGRILLRAEPASDGSGFALISVTDTGIGIPSDAMNHIAERYFKVGCHANGSGLGLAISKEILLLHGGNLTVASPPPGQDRGTQVTIRIPLSTPPTVLVVSGDSNDQTLLRQQLSSQGYSVEAVCHGDCALKRAEAGNLAIILVDMIHEDIKGIDVILALKQSTTFRNIPLLAVTGPTLEEAVGSVLSRFGVSTLFKPWTHADLIERVEGVLLSKTAFQMPKQEKEV